MTWGSDEPQWTLKRQPRLPLPPWERRRRLIAAGAAAAVVGGILLLFAGLGIFGG